MIVPIETDTVTFESNGGSSVNSIKDVVKDSLITTPKGPTREGYSFVSWYMQSGLINKWDFSSDTVSSDITLYAQWDKVDVSVVPEDRKPSVLPRSGVSSSVWLYSLGLGLIVVGSITLVIRNSKKSKKV